MITDYVRQSCFLFFILSTIYLQVVVDLGPSSTVPSSKR